MHRDKFIFIAAFLSIAPTHKHTEKQLVMLWKTMCKNELRYSTFIYLYNLTFNNETQEAACSSKTVVIFCHNCSIYPATSIANPCEYFRHPHNTEDDHNAKRFSNYCSGRCCTVGQFLVFIFLCEQH